MQSIDRRHRFRRRNFRKLGVNGSQHVVKADCGVNIGNLFNDARAILRMDNLHSDGQILKFHSPDFRRRAEFWQLLSRHKFKFHIGKRFDPPPVIGQMRQIERCRLRTN